MKTGAGRLLLRVSTLLFVLMLTAGAWAGDPDAATLAKASALYDAGRKAHAEKRHADAARAFAQADVVVPDEAALEAGLVAVLQTDDAVLGMDLASRASRAPGHAKLSRLADMAKARFHDRVGRIVVHCDACTVVVDGVPNKRGVASWVGVGEHTVVIRDGEAKERRKVVVEAGAVVTILPLSPEEKAAEPAPSPDAKPEPSPKKQRDEAGPSSSWFWIGFAATAAVGVGAVISGVDTFAKHTDFTERPTDEAAAEGDAAQTRTNVLLAVTGGLAAVTLALGLFVVDWDQDDDVSVGPEGLTVRF